MSKMIKQIILDWNNYDPGLEELTRTAIRGIVIVNGRLLLLVNKNGRLSFPGGGQEFGETDIDTLMREMQEETGYKVLPNSIMGYFEVVEKRMAGKEAMIWHQINRYYLCDIDNTAKGNCNFSENEKELGIRETWLGIDEAIYGILHRYENQEECKKYDREYNLFVNLKEYLNDADVYQKS